MTTNLLKALEKKAYVRCKKHNIPYQPHIIFKIETDAEIKEIGCSRYISMIFNDSLVEYKLQEQELESDLWYYEYD